MAATRPSRATTGLRTTRRPVVRRVSGPPAAGTRASSRARSFDGDQVERRAVRRPRRRLDVDGARRRSAASACRRPPARPPACCGCRRTASARCPAGRRSTRRPGSTPAAPDRRGRSRSSARAARRPALASTTKTLVSLVRSASLPRPLMKAIRCPSGDHAGSVSSQSPEVSVSTAPVATVSEVEMRAPVRPGSPRRRA